MKRTATPVKLILLLLLSVFTNTRSSAAVGDTVVVQAHLNVHLNNYGDFDVAALFPPDTFHCGKILMKYTLGCPSTGCSPWDYTTQVFARINTGNIDSTSVNYPSFTFNGSSPDSLPVNNNPVYIYVFNSTTGLTDSSLASPFTVYFHNDSIDPTANSDSAYYYPGNYYNYIYDNTGAVTDSLYVGYDVLLTQTYTTVYTTFPVMDDYELGRVMTPYAQGFPLTWRRDFMFDITEYKPILHDSLMMRVHYDGYSDGFTATVVFYFIEGTPPRTATRVRLIYPTKYYEYGITTNPIENYLINKSFDVDPNETQASIRVIPSGHSFGGALNCAEFCQKYYRFMVNGVSRFPQLVWRNDCGLNPLYPQPGTWLYDRSNWCPGNKAIPRYHELTPYITPGDSVQLDMNFDTYTYSGGAGFNPGYILSTHLITFDSINFQVNAAVEEIIAPNSDFEYNRVNPICSYPVIVIKNYGAQPLTSADIGYGILGGAQGSYHWTGNLNFNESATVTLGALAWGGTTTPDVFRAWISNPNGGADDYPYNDTLRSTVSFTPMLPTQFALLWQTNSAYTQTTYQLTDINGNVLYTNGVLAPNTLYRDTFNLAQGCYQLKITDAGKDGLYFFANSSGAGYARLVKTLGAASIIKSFSADFGTSIVYNFTVGFMTAVEEHVSENVFGISPNPSKGSVIVDIILAHPDDLELSVYNQLGEIVYTHSYNNFIQDMIQLDLQNQPAGMYYVTMQTSKGKETRKLILE